MKNNEIMISVQFNFPNDSNKYSEKFSGITDSLAFLVKDDITLRLSSKVCIMDFIIIFQSTLFFSRII